MKPAHEFSNWFLGTWTWAVCAFIVAPLIFVVAVSFTPLDHISLPSQGISLRWYEQMWSHTEFVGAAANSMLIAVLASCTAMVLGVLSAIASVRYRFAWLQPLRFFVTSPLFIPMVMIGLAVLTFFSTLGISSNVLRLYVGHAALTLPYVFRTVSTSLSGFDLNQEYAARNLGASALDTFFLITLPQIAPGIFAGGIFALIVSFDNVGISIFLTGSQFTTLPVELFTYASYSNDPMTAAISVVMILVSMITIGLIEWIFGLNKLMRV
ncbi:MAG: ABC transporter permease [Burkholderiales bacterium]